MSEQTMKTYVMTISGANYLVTRDADGNAVQFQIVGPDTPLTPELTNLPQSSKV